MLSRKVKDFDVIIKKLSDEIFQKSPTESFDKLYANYVDKLSYLSGLLRVNYAELFKDKNYSDEEKIEFIQNVKSLNHLFFEFKKSNFDKNILNEILPTLENVLKVAINLETDKEFQKIKNNLVKGLSFLQSSHFSINDKPRNNIDIPIQKSNKYFYILYFLLFLLFIVVFNIVVMLAFEFILIFVY